MLSGAFLLDNDKNKNYKYFYKKTFKKIVIPTIIFSILYFLPIFIRNLFLIESKTISEIFEPVKNFLIGQPSSHLWYLYMLIGVYILVPIVIRVKNDISQKTFEKVSIVFLALASISYWTSSYTLNYDIGMVFEFLGYLMIGYTIRNNSHNKNSKKAVLYIILSITINIIAFYLNYLNITNKMPTDTQILKNSWISPLSPLIVISSVLLFMAFSNFNIKRDFSKLASYSFYIYLIHQFVLITIFELIEKSNIQFNSLIFIPMITVIGLIGSYILSIVYLKVWNYIENKYNFSEKITIKLIK